MPDGTPPAVLRLLGKRKRVFRIARAGAEGLHPELRQLLAPVAVVLADDRPEHRGELAALDEQVLDPLHDLVLGDPGQLRDPVERAYSHWKERRTNGVEPLDFAAGGPQAKLLLETSGLFPSLREYHDRFGIRMEHLDRYPDLRVMHPGPVNRGVELASEVVDHERAVILDQVTNGVAVRMAVLLLLAGGGQTEEA